MNDAVLRWLFHDLASPVATVLTASEMLGPDEDQELRDMVTEGAKRLAARLKLLRIVLTPGTADVAGPALAKLISEAVFPAHWAGGAAPLSSARATALAALSLTMNWTAAELTGDGISGHARPQEPVMAALAGFEPDSGAGWIAALAGKVTVVTKDGQTTVSFPAA